MSGYGREGMDELEVFGIVVLSEEFETQNPMPGEKTYATGFVATDTANLKALAKNPVWQKIVPLGFRPVVIAMAPKSNYCNFQLFAIADMPQHIEEFAKTAAPTVVQEWLGERLQKKYGDEALAEWNKWCAAK